MCGIILFSRLLKNTIKNPILGKIDILEHEIEVLNRTPFFLLGYTIPIPKQQAVQKELNRLKQLKIIRPSLSKFCSPVFVILKKNGKIKIAIDFRLLNSISIPLKFPTPTIYDLVREIKKSKIF